MAADEDGRADRRTRVGTSEVLTTESAAAVATRGCRRESSRTAPLLSILPWRRPPVRFSTPTNRARNVINSAALNTLARAHARSPVTRTENNYINVKYNKYNNNMDNKKNTATKGREGVYLREKTSDAVTGLPGSPVQNLHYSVPKTR